jgi:hypothetical protein
MEENIRFNKIFGQAIGAFSHPDVLDPSRSNFECNKNPSLDDALKNTLIQ